MAETRQGQVRARGQFRAQRIPTPAGIPEHERTPDPIAAKPTNADRLATILIRAGHQAAVESRKWGRDVTLRELRATDPDNLELHDGDDDDVVTLGGAPYTIEQRGNRTIIRLTETATHADDDPFDPFEYVGVGNTMSDALTDLEQQIDAREKERDDATN
jgi:hypothetical protein